MDQYLQGLGSNRLGRPISFENVRTVPVGPMTHLMVFDGSVRALAALSCMKHIIKQNEIYGFMTSFKKSGYLCNHYLCQFFPALLHLIFSLLPT